MKESTQTLFQQGNFSAAAKVGEEALLLAQQLPPASAMGELVQILLNLTTCYLELRQMAQAEATSERCLKLGEQGQGLNPRHPPATEVLSLALGARALVLMHGGRCQEAVGLAQRSVALSEGLYPRNDPRVCKPLRTLALALEKTDCSCEAEKTLLRCYTILSLSLGVESRDAQSFFEELVNVSLRRGDLLAAERYAAKNYRSVKDKDAGKNGVALGDAAARLGFIHARQGLRILYVQTVFYSIFFLHVREMG
jgi:tetratricopeptide (TPR) repeat protein